MNNNKAPPCVEWCSNPTTYFMCSPAQLVIQVETKKKNENFLPLCVSFVLSNRWAVDENKNEYQNNKLDSKSLQKRFFWWTMMMMMMMRKEKKGKTQKKADVADQLFEKKGFFSSK